MNRNRPIGNPTILLLWLSGWLPLTTRAQAPSTTFRPGMLIDTVVCQQTPTQSYALYLPSYYQAAKSWPVVYLFDPAARGSLPIQHFRQAAEKYGFVLVGSNNSRNGPWQPSFDAATAMSADAQWRFALDPKRVYTSGFSGGSRAASAIAVLSGQVAGVIGCGAGWSALPEHQPKAHDTLLYVGIVGNQDMNYREMRELDQRLSELKITHQLLIFEGDHQWPPSETITEAMGWLVGQEMKKGRREMNTQWMGSIYQSTLQKAQQQEAAGRLYDAWQTYQRLLTYYDSSAANGQLQEKLARLEQTPEMKKAFQLQEEIRRKELSAQSAYADAFREALSLRYRTGNDSLNEGWWRTEVKHLNKLQKSAIAEEQWLGKRLLDQLWRSCAEQGSQFLNQKDYPAARISFRLWTLIQPDSPYPYFQLAKVYALTQKTSLSIQQLEKALERGLTPISLIETTPAFEALRNEKRYKKLKEKWSRP